LQFRLYGIHKTLITRVRISRALVSGSGLSPEFLKTGITDLRDNIVGLFEQLV